MSKAFVFFSAGAVLVLAAAVPAFSQPAQPAEPVQSAQPPNGSFPPVEQSVGSACNPDTPSLLKDGEGHEMSVHRGESMIEGDYVFAVTDLATNEKMAMQLLTEEEYQRMSEVLKAFDEQCAGECLKLKEHLTLGKMYERPQPVQDHVFLMEFWPPEKFIDAYAAEKIKEGLYDNRKHAYVLLTRVVEVAGLARAFLEMGYVHLDIYADTIFVKQDGTLLLSSIEEIYPLTDEEQVTLMMKLVDQLIYGADHMLTDLPHLRLADDAKADEKINGELQAMMKKVSSGGYFKEAQGTALKERALSALDAFVVDLKAVQESVKAAAGPR